ncbi:MAG: DNA-binding protein [Parabacteroides sp.]|nr:DNA-binding protein [Parabacteroides sp.]
MGIAFGLYATPQPRGKESREAKHARALACGTKTLNDICYVLSDRCTLTSADIKGVLDGLAGYIRESLEYGYHVELEGLGIFSPSLRSRPQTLPSGKQTVKAEVAGINFRCACELKAAVRRIKINPVKTTSTPFDLEERKKRMTDYLQKHPYLNITDYRSLNSCTYYRAKQDLNRFLADGILRQAGRNSHKNYLLIQQG